MKKYPGQYAMREAGVSQTLKIQIFTILFFFVLCVIWSAVPVLAGADNFDVKTETIDGVKVVSNPAYPRGGKVKLELKHELTIGDDEDAEVLLYHPHDVQADNSGNIYIWEYKLACLKVYDRQGRFLRQIGRKGQGPGEFSTGACFSLLTGDKISFLDGDKRRITIFSTKGEFIKDFRYDSNWECIKLRSDNNNQLYISKKVISYEPNYRLKFRVFDVENHLYRVDTVRNEWHLIKVLKGEKVAERSTGKSGMMLGTGFHLIWNVDSRGNIVTGLNKSYDLSVFSSQGKLKFKFSRSFTPKKNKKLKKIKKHIGGTEKPYGFFPAFGFKILFGEKDRIWIEKFKSGDEYKKVVYDIFSKDGIYLLQVVFPYRIYQFKNSKVYGIAVKRDERVIKRTAILSGLD